MGETKEKEIESGESDEQVLFEGHPAAISNVWVLLGSILTLGIYFLISWVRAKGTSYRVTTRRIVTESGLLSKKLEQIDLYRISDYTVARPFSQRLVGTGNLLLKTVDKTTPELNLVALKTDVVALYERLRAATEADKQRRGVRLVDYE